VLVITGRTKRALEDHFDRVPSLEAALERKGDEKKLAAIQESSNLGDIHYVRQGDPKGLGHAVLCAQRHVGDEPFAVLLGDDLIDERDELLAEMIRVQQATGGSVVALMEVPREAISAYGSADVTAVEGESFVQVHGLVEKPAPEDAPSNLAIIGRYVLHPAVFDVLQETGPGRGGEIQLTDALQTLAARDGEGGGVYGVVFRGRRYDTGDKLSYLKAVVTLACGREEFGEDLRSWLRDFVVDGAGEPAATV
jgi:UTP--glucose-1-phosphate uridylyltransferase